MMETIKQKLAWKVMQWKEGRAKHTEGASAGLLAAGAVVPGGAFLWDPVAGTEIFTPERFSAEQKEFGKLARDFANNEILPKADLIERQEPGVLVSLLKKAGELGLLGVDIPEEYGGLGADKTTSMLIAENISVLASFAVSVGAHAGIGTLPILFYGTPEQRKRYLPDLATGKRLAAYALTEADSGSDALAAKATATPTADGKSYVLSGAKQFITNAGFADVFVVFAQVPGERGEPQFTAFIVDKETQGVSTGAEEHKMGIKGSSTRSLRLDSARVPAENLLGEIGKGYRIAFDILDAGRLRLGVGSTGGCKQVLALSAKFASERRQFGKPIAEFGLIRQKLAGIVMRTYAAESMAYRTTGLIDAAVAKLAPGDPDRLRKTAKALAEYAIECSILKVYGSEALNYAVDEGVQIHGGYGFIEEYPIARTFRDSRINRIFEGTNEINRLLIPGTLFRRAAKGELPLVSEVERVRAALEKKESPKVPDGPLDDERRAVTRAKWVFLSCAGAALQKHLKGVQEEQELLGALADMAIEIFAMDSCLARTLMRLAAPDAPADDIAVDVTRLLVHDGYLRVVDNGHKALESLFAGESLAEHLLHEARLDLHRPLAWVESSRRIAKHAIEHGGYAL